MTSYKKLLMNEQFSAEDIRNAALIIHPQAVWYNITTDEIAQVFEEGSNFTQLENPIIDTFGNEFRDNEWYYMASRTPNQNIKKMISFLSSGYGLSTKARTLFPLQQDEKKRIRYMREGIQKKFDNNPKLKAALLSTGEKAIIEYTYRGDTFFGIDQDTLQGKNILWKLLMEYRDAHTL